MNICSYLELAEKDVINVCTGEKLGRICDLQICTKSADVVNIITPGQSGMLGFGKATEVIIPWNKIECIGEDTVLVRLSSEEQSGCTVPKRKIKRHLFDK